jgi:hypothetical protein
MGRTIGGGLVVATVVAAIGCAGGTPQEMAPAIAPNLGAQAVYERFVEALGGRDAMELYEQSTATGTFSMPSQGINGDLLVQAMAPNLLAIEVNIPAIGVVRQGFDGEVGWSMNPMTGPMVLEGAMLDQLRQQADFLGPLNMQAYVDSADVVGEEEFDGRACQNVRLVTKWGEEYFEYYDVATGLMAGSIRTQEGPMGAMEQTTIVSEYQEFGGLLVPTKTVQRTMGMDQVITVTNVSFEPIDPSVFALPKQIQSMVGQP